MTALQIINRIMAALLAVWLGPLLAKADLHLSPSEYATLATALGVSAVTAYHWYEAHARSKQSASIPDIVDRVIDSLKSAPAGAPANPTQPPAAPALSEKKR